MEEARADTYCKDTPKGGVYAFHGNSAGQVDVGGALGEQQREWPGEYSQLPGPRSLGPSEKPRSLSSQRLSVPPDLFCFLSLNQTLSDSFTVSR